MSVDLSSYTTTLPGDSREMLFALDHVMCGACAAKIERNVSALPGVESARVNLTDKRLLLRWKDGQFDPSTIPSELQDLGYDGSPFRAADSDGQDRGDEHRDQQRTAIGPEPAEMADDADARGHEQQRQMREQPAGGRLDARVEAREGGKRHQQRRHADHRARQRQAEGAGGDLAAELENEEEGNGLDHHGSPDGAFDRSPPAGERKRKGRTLRPAPSCSRFHS